MKSLYFTITAILVIVTLSSGVNEIMFSSGIAGYTGAPGEATCTNCHNENILNAAGGSIELRGVPTTGYQLGETYNLTVVVKRTNVSRYGFAVAALNSNNANGGTLAATQTGTQTLQSGQRTNITHTTPLQNADSASFSFTWTAPSTNIGNITFYFTGNAVDGDGSTSGDFVYSGSRTLPAALPNSIKNPNISSKVFIFPDAQRQEIRVLLPQQVKSQITIHNTNGQQLYSQTFNETEINIPSHQFSKGIYLITISNNEQVKTQKVVLK